MERKSNFSALAEEKNLLAQTQMLKNKYIVHVKKNEESKEISLYHSLSDFFFVEKQTVM